MHRLFNGLVAALKPFHKSVNITLLTTMIVIGVWVVGLAY
jgi:hypothetical protein